MITEGTVTTVTEVLPEPDLRVDSRFRPRWLHESIRVQTKKWEDYVVYKHLISKAWKLKTDEVVIKLDDACQVLGLTKAQIRDQINILIEMKRIKPIKFDSIHSDVKVYLPLISHCTEMWKRMDLGFGGVKRGPYQ